MRKLTTAMTVETESRDRLAAAASEDNWFPARVLKRP